AWKINQSPLLTSLFIGPGNAGTQQLGTNLPINPTDFDGVKKAVLDNQIQMVIVGPEASLVKGIHDYFAKDISLKEVTVIGPGAVGAQLEGSKKYAKEFMKRHAIPTADYKSFSSEEIEEAKDFLKELKPPYVLKADGLAAGKGVLILDDIKKAEEELESMLLDAKFGEASSTVVVEEFLSGVELSCFVLTDGEKYKLLPFAKDYKRIGEGDTGLNTGGMGAISPVPFNEPAFKQKIIERVVEPTIKGLQQEGIPYTGFVFIGLIKVGSDPYVIEYNVRLGDPETEVVLPRITSDLLETFVSIREKRFDNTPLEIDPEYAITIMTVSGGYPEAYEKGKPIKGLENLDAEALFHAGTKEENGVVYTNGGRVLAVRGRGVTMKKALEQGYSNIKCLQYEGMYYRKDIGFDL
ncbi:MAG: phosphoribosylamine--glycine ligase, partial [Bacteroidia bacterium]|nr:phosphoribosylamine--glycine ligase [Bacteroidia bacterium]